MSQAGALVDAGGGELRFEAAVRRDRVHKSAIEQVLITDFRQLDDNRFVCAGQAPRAHAFFSDTLTPAYDPLMLLESARQGFVVAVHEMKRVPRSSQFVFTELDMSVGDRAALAVGSEPAELVWQARFSDPRYVRGELAGLNAAADLFVDGRRCLEMSGAGAFMSARLYRMMRRHRRAAPPQRATAPVPLPPSAVGRRDPANVVIAEPTGAGTELSAEVVVHRGHSSFFDHPLDHVPAMLLVEALRQTAVAAAGRVHGVDPAAAVVVGCGARYGRYAELDTPVFCDASVGERVGDEVRVELALRQLDRSVAGGSVTLRFEG
jgi:2-oxo-3-(phosphooxy)propyl 3-oxoalkanoate synthase